jgi:translation initiation factor IF-1
VSGKDGIEIEGRIVEVLGARLYRVELSNGHRLVAHVEGRKRPTAERRAVGEKVRVRVSPYDLSEGSIRGGSE